MLPLVTFCPSCCDIPATTLPSVRVLQRDSDMQIAISHVHLYFVKRSMSEPIAMLPQV